MAKSFSLSDTNFEGEIIGASGIQTTAAGGIGNSIGYDINTGASQTSPNVPSLYIRGQTADYAIVNNSTNKRIKIKKLAYAINFVHDDNVNNVTETSAVVANNWNLSKITGYTDGHMLETTIIKLDSASANLPSTITFCINPSALTGETVIKRKQIPFTKSTAAYTHLNLFANSNFAKKYNQGEYLCFVADGTAEKIILNNNEGIALGWVASSNKFLRNNTVFSIKLRYLGNSYIVRIGTEIHTPKRFPFAMMNASGNAVQIDSFEVENIQLGVGANTTFSQMNANGPAVFYNLYKNMLGKNIVPENAIQANLVKMDTNQSLTAGIGVYKNIIPIDNLPFVEFRQIFTNPPMVFPWNTYINTGVTTQTPFGNRWQGELKNNQFLSFKNGPLVINPGEVFIITVLSAFNPDTKWPLTVGIDFIEEDVPVTGGVSVYETGYAY